MFTLKSLSKGTSAGQFKTVKEAVDAAVYANEAKAGGTDDWIPEEKAPGDFSAVKTAANKALSEIQNLQRELKKADSGWDLSEFDKVLRQVINDPRG
jgi:hypothetical protein